MANRTDWIYDELLCFLGNPFFQIPVVTFMEANCIIFDASIEDSPDYRKIYADYKNLVGQLLDGFMKDTKLTHDAVIKALSDMNAKADLREIFQGLFEQVLASDDYTIFVRLMIQKNIELQQQALLLIIQTQGELPVSLQDEGSQKPEEPKPKKQSQEPVQGQQSEEEIMKAILEQSKREYEEEEKKKMSAVKNFEKEKKRKEKEKETLIAISTVEHSRLEGEKVKEQERLDEALQQLSVNDASSKPPPAPVVSKPPPSKPVKQTDLKSAPSISVTPAAPLLMASTSKANVSGSEAAANWLKQAQNESSNSSGTSSAVNAAAAALSNLSPDELKKRQEYLKEQRDKLLEMKKKEREKQLLTAEKTQPQRPMSARAAKSALSKTTGQADTSKQLSPEEEKKLAMRKAIADRLKSEVLGQK